MSKLRGIKPTAVKKRLKALFYGVAGAGKTTCAINFPFPYLIDCEKGASNDQYVRILESNGGALFQTSDFDELLKEVKLLLTETHPYKTLVIDPLTTVYNDLLDKSAEKVGSEFGRHYAEANKQMKNLINLLGRLDMNVIITSHSKTEYLITNHNGRKEMVTLGQTFDCYKKLDYLFDLVFEVQKQGNDRVGYVRKSRVESIPDGSSFKWDYKTLAEKYGIEVIEKETVPEILATTEQVERLKQLVDLYKEQKETVQKWLDKAECCSFEEMNQSIIEKIIIHLESRALKQ